MIIKEADDKSQQINTLQALMERQDCAPETRKRIEQEIRNIRAGFKGEAEAAYEMKVKYGDSLNWMVLHDLRIVHGDLVAQLDHLLINRCMDLWVCESKHFSEGITINEHGEFLAYFGSKPYGLPSPIEQNSKHILILNKIFDSSAVELPRRMGFTIKPNFKSLVLVSKNARISRPKSKFDGLDSIIKNDQLSKTIDKSIDNDNNPLFLAKVISQSTLIEVAKSIAKLHKPIEFNWAAKFGMSAIIQTHAYQPSNNETLPDSSETITQKKPIAEVKPKQKLICHECGLPVPYNVAKFCWFNKPKFNGNIYCMECQKTAKSIPSI